MGNWRGNFHKGILIISETAVIKGKLEVNALTLNGLIEGEVAAKERVEIHAKGKLYGNISTPALVIQDGGIFEGNCKMGRDLTTGVIWRLRKMPFLNKSTLDLDW